MSLYFLKNSLVKKIILHVLIVGALGAGTFFALHTFDIVSVPLKMAVMITAGISLLYLLFMYVEFIHPIQKIMHEMKALLTGKRYRRVYTKRMDEIGVIGHFFNEITQNLERISHDLTEHKRISKELDVAHQIQQNLLPKAAPQIPDLDIVAKTKPAEEIGGDSFDFMETEENLFFYIGDVTGHGVPAGLVMIMVDTLLDTFIDKGMNTKDVLINTNKYLEPKLSATMFMTMVMFRWEKKTEKLFYCGAGHEHVIIFRQKTGTCDVFPSGGIALGMVPDNTALLKETEIRFEKGDTLVLYTDGVSEGENPRGELYGLKRIQEITQKYGRLETSSLLFEEISKHFSNFLEGHIQDDDMSLMILKYK